MFFDTLFMDDKIRTFTVFFPVCTSITMTVGQSQESELLLSILIHLSFLLS